AENDRLGVGIGDQVFDVSAGFGVASMRDFMAMAKSERLLLRRRIADLLTQESMRAAELLTPMYDVELRLPCEPGDYTDFYASIHHATNVGSMFRPDNPLLPNYKWLPVAYHGRASSVILSGTPVTRPSGQIPSSPGGPPVYSPTQRLDYELEL